MKTKNLADVFKIIVKCLAENYVVYETLSISPGDGVEIVVNKEEAEKEYIYNAIRCMEDKLPPALRYNIKLKVVNNGISDG